MLPSEIKEALEQYGVVPTKARGQNFLKDERVASREIDYLDPDPRDTVLEIGPGLGILTDILVEKAGRVIAIELDRGMAEYSRNRYGDSIVLIEGDALKIPFPGFDRFISKKSAAGMLALQIPPGSAILEGMNHHQATVGGGRAVDAPAGGEAQETWRS